MGQGKTPMMVTNGPNSPPNNEKEMGMSMSLLEINSAVTAFVIKSPARAIKSHSRRVDGAVIVDMVMHDVGESKILRQVYAPYLVQQNHPEFRIMNEFCHHGI